MTFCAIGSAEAEEANAQASGIYGTTSTGDGIVASPGGFPGTFAFMIDPVNSSVPVLELYGWTTSAPTPNLLSIPFMFRFAADFDATVTICELGDRTADGIIVRRLSLNTSEEFVISDEDGNAIGTSNIKVTATDIQFIDGGAGADTITSVASEFGFLNAGEVITVAGSASNDGSYTIVSVTAGTITLATGVLTNEGVGSTVTISVPAVANSTDYWLLWYVDLRVEAASRDILWIWRFGAWNKVVDVADHGEGKHLFIDGITFGTAFGKGLPTAGGPFYVKEMAVQVLNETPNDTALGSVTTYLKMPDGDGPGTDADFDGGDDDGGGWGNPDSRNVDEIPPDGDTSYDEGDASGEKSSYTIAAATGVPLAIQVVGQGGRVGGTGVTLRTYLIEDSTRDYADSFTVPAGYRILSSQVVVAKTYNEVNGNAIDATLFNGLEAGLELVTVSGGSTYRLSQIGLEYITDGPKAVPGDFPALGPRTVDVAGGAMVGSANPMVV